MLELDKKGKNLKDDILQVQACLHADLFALRLFLSFNFCVTSISMSLQLAFILKNKNYQIFNKALKNFHPEFKC